MNNIFQTELLSDAIKIYSWSILLWKLLKHFTKVFRFYLLVAETCFTYYLIFFRIKHLVIKKKFNLKQSH